MLLEGNVRNRRPRVRLERSEARWVVRALHAGRRATETSGAPGRWLAKRSCRRHNPRWQVREARWRTLVPTSAPLAARCSSAGESALVLGPVDRLVGPALGVELSDLE